MKASHFFVIVFTLCPAYWGYENYKLMKRVDAALAGGETEYSENVTSRLCIGIRWGFFDTEQPTEFNIYDRNGQLFNERFSKSLIGGCGRHHSRNRATWTKLEA